ncbi:MAG: FAD-dependent oxidoreductase [Candidatus Diapherotrites archaeon]
MQKFDVAIIGAGPAGLFAAWELANSKLKIAVIDEGKEPMARNPAKTPSDAIFGVGGAGAYSDGKLNLTHEIGGSPADLKRNNSDIQKMIDVVDSTLVKFGIPKNCSGVNGSELEELKRKANKEGIEFVSGKQKHIGTDEVRKIINRFYLELKKKGIKFLLETKVKKIKKNKAFFELETSRETIKCSHLICAPGRGNAYWLREELKKLGAITRYGPIDVGVRLEFPAGIYEKTKKVMYDAKFRLYTETYDDMVRTFCTNPNGFISVERFDDFVLVNGHAERNRKSPNTNLALLVRVHLTDPVEDSTEYARSIAKLAHTIGGGKPILQRYKDLRKGRRSTWERIHKSPIEPTLTDVTPGDISMALPARIVHDIIEAIEKLDKVIPGIASETTLIYAPEIKFYDTRYETNLFLETNIPGLFVAGDASGFSRGIVYAAVTGMIAAQGIKKKTAK